MCLMKLSEYAKTIYAHGSTPCNATLRKMCQNGDIKGAVKQGNRWFVDTSSRELDERLDALLDDETILDMVS